MRLTALQWAVVVLCFAVNALDGFDIQAIAFTAPSIRDAWTLSGRTLGVVFSAGLVGMAVGSILLGALSDRIGRRRTILLCVALFGTATLLTGAARNVPELIALRFLTGLGIGGVLPSLNTLVAEYSPERRRNLLVAVMHLGYPIGAMTGGLIAAQIIPEHGWRWVFYGGGLATLALWPLLAAALPESPQYLLGRSDARSRERGLTLLARIGQRADTGPEPGASGPDRGPGILARAGGMRTRTLALWSGFFLGYLALYFLMSWIPTLLVDAGLALDRSIYAGIALNVGGGIGMLALGHWSATRGLRPLIMGFFIAAALSMAVQFGAKAPVGEPGVPEAVAATIELCAQAQLGMPYAEHAARLTVGARVTWTHKQAMAHFGEAEGTIVEVLESGNLAVEGKASGKRASFFTPGHLRLA